MNGQISHAQSKDIEVNVERNVERLKKNKGERKKDKSGMQKSTIGPAQNTATAG